MPEICRFYGIIILMFADDHNPPHFHVRYGDQRAVISIKKGIVTGQMSRKELAKIYTWMDLHYNEILDNWNRLKNGQEPLSIKPLE
ncbi:MAG: DUF4160 domain-containing protein [Bacteroidales bacterium]|nr:DUF4160 domain-containing protein [Bacteroidales bacterium]